MKRKRIVVWAALAVCAVVVALAVLLPLGSSAKRGRPPKVPPVEIAGTEYRAPNTYSTEGFIEAWDTKSQTFLWRKKIYHTLRIPYPFAEEDNQWVFIKSMTVGKSGDDLIIVNEAGRQYADSTSPPNRFGIVLKIGALLLWFVFVYFVFLLWSKRGGDRESKLQN